jgi:hypothetical protein
MNKETFLAGISVALTSGLVTKKDILGVLERVAPSDEKEGSQSKIATILYYIGGLVMFLGIAFFIGQKWGEMASALRIFVTLGFGMLFFVSGSILVLRKAFLGFSDAFQLIAGLLIPSGVFVTLYELGYRDGNYGKSIIFLALGILWFLAYHYQRRVVVAIFSILFGSIAYILFSGTFLSKLDIFPSWDPFLYLILGLGLSYIVLGHALKDRRLKILSGPLYFFGAPIVLGTAMGLGGYAPDQRILWEHAYPAVLFAGLYLSVYLKSRSVLIFSSLFLVGYVTKIMFEYFDDKLSGPLLFIFAGMVIMGTGYLTLCLNRKYFKRG